jgi:hypothetical protein
MAVLFACIATAQADATDKRVGVGLGVGVATGPNLQVKTSPATHVDVGVGLQFDEDLRVQADHAWRLADLSESASVSVPLYLGVGGFLGEHGSRASAGGVRMPVGLQADFAGAPIQVFGELSPELAFVIDDDDMAPPPDTLALTGLMGVRAAF